MTRFVRAPTFELIVVVRAWASFQMRPRPARSPKPLLVKQKKRTLSKQRPLSVEPAVAD